jgi:hypothetical protein
MKFGLIFGPRNKLLPEADPCGESWTCFYILRLPGSECD